MFGGKSNGLRLRYNVRVAKEALKNPIVVAGLVILALAVTTSGIYMVYAAPTIIGRLSVAEEAEEVEGVSPTEIAMSLFMAAIPVSASCVASALAIRAVVTAGSAAMAERPELAIWVIVLAGLAEGIAIYGLLISIMMLGKI